MKKDLPGGLKASNGGEEEGSANRGERVEISHQKKMLPFQISTKFKELYRIEVKWYRSDSNEVGEDLHAELEFVSLGLTSAKEAAKREWN